MQRSRRSLVSAISAIALTLGLVSTIPVVFAYGNNTQWQTAFSGTCNVTAYCGQIGLPPGTTGGFWGWCAFGGSNGASSPGTTGTQGDCQITVYIDSPGQQGSNPFHTSQDVAGWVIAENVPHSICSLFPADTPCFFVTGGTVEFTGPGSPGPTGVQLPVPCTANPADNAGNPTCDTGIPAVPGHFALHPAPGVHLNIQVNKIG
jgi:hypothetical protein